MLDRSIDLLRYFDKPLYVIQIPVSGVMHEELFTKIPWREFKRLKMAQAYTSIEKEQLEEQVFRDFVLPEGKYDLYDIQNLPAGVITTVFNVIYALSDSGTFPNEEGVLDFAALEHRFNIQRMNVRTQLELQMMTTVCAVFKGYTFEDLERLPFDKIMQLFAAAEKHMLDVGALNEPLSFTPVDPGPEDPETDNSSVEELKGALGDLGEEGPIDEPKIVAKPQQMDSDEDAFMSMASDFAKNKKQKEEIMSIPEEVEAPVFELLKKRGDLEKKLNLSTLTSEEMEKEADRTDIELVKPVYANRKHPAYHTMKALEDKRVDAINRARLGNRLDRTEILAPPKRNVETKAGMVSVPNIDHGAEITAQDYGPVMTEEEAMVVASEQGLFPAGYEIIQARKERKTEDSKLSLEQEYKKRVGDRRISLKERKIIMRDLKDAGFVS